MNGVGFIPTELTVVCAKPSERKYNGRDYTYRKAFVLDAGNAKKLETARRWAGAPYGETMEFNMSNDPVSGLQIIGLEHRSEGGVAYKILYSLPETDVMVDVREDTMLDVMEMCGIGPQGKMNGTFVWAVWHSQMRLILVGSKDYKDLMVLSEARNQTVIKPSEFVVGGVYKGRANEAKIYLGEVHAYRWSDKNGWNKIKTQLWYNPYSFQDWDKGYNEFINPESTRVSIWTTAFVIPKSLRKKIGQVEVPANILKTVSDRVVREAMKNFDYYQKNTWWKNNDESRLAQSIRSYLEKGLIEEAEDVFIPKELIEFLPKEYIK